MSQGNSFSPDQGFKQVAILLCAFGAQLNKQDSELFHANMMTALKKCRDDGVGTQIPEVVYNAVYETTQPPQE